ncbi:tripartite motif-containing protein 16-like [Scleropages formosus]|uniref:Tripartite motif-containing protein 16-like n=1 Tax=Scleropages formosus TaxID=113540 RepID=A0A8C9T8R0_SCLFO|nr:tripartite motif-containing protein 16-like [Scleropages formosus]
MAEAGDLLDEDQFNCSVCLDLLKDPVTIPCGHSYCMGCIKGTWDQEGKAGANSCPQCRQTFAPRPVLNVNAVMAEVLKKLKKTGVETPSPDNCYAEPGDVVCDVCTGRKNKAIKSCLVCLASYCETHLKLHNKLNPGKRHKLIDATGKLQDKICSHHDIVLQVYCRTDQQCICLLCTMDEHKGHDTVSIAAERSEKQEQLGSLQKKFQKKIKDREEELQELRQAVDSLTRSAKEVVEDGDRTFTEMIRSLVQRRSELKDVIKAQKKAAVSEAEGLLDQLEKEIDELKKGDAELEQISHSEDHIHFLQTFQSLCSPPGSEELPSININPKCSFEDVKKTVSQLKEQLENLSQNELAEISKQVTELSIFLPLNPKTREEFLQYTSSVTLDENTASTSLRLNGDKYVAAGQTQSRPNHAERFVNLPQVLCREGLTGCCYWEVQWSGNGGIDIAVAYKGVNRKEGVGNFRCNDKSWSLFCSPNSYYFYHNSKSAVLPFTRSFKIGVYLDHRAGALSFYSVSGTMTLLHRVQTTFTEPLYPGFSLYSNSYVQL